MSEQDDNRKAQSEALGRALAEAMDGDRLHPDNQPQVGTRLDAMCDVCGRAFAEHRSGLLNEAYCPRFIEAHWCGWLPTTFVPQPTPAEPTDDEPNEADLVECPSCSEAGGADRSVKHLPPICKSAKTPAEPRSESVPDERAQAQNDWNELLLEIARLYALIDDEWADADIGEMDEFDPWHALRELTKRMVGAQPEPEERAEFEKFWGRVEFDDWPIDWKKAKKIWDAAQQSLKDAPTPPPVATSVSAPESAEQFYAKSAFNFVWYRSNGDIFEFAEAYASEYSSSSSAALEKEYEAQIAAFNDLADQCRKVTTDLLTVRDSRDRLQEALRAAANHLHYVGQEQAAGQARAALGDPPEGK